MPKNRQEQTAQAFLKTKNIPDVFAPFQMQEPHN